MSALFTALLESETKESLANMVCELRAAIRLVSEDPAAWVLSKGTQGAVVAALAWQPTEARPPAQRRKTEEEPRGFQND